MTPVQGEDRSLTPVQKRDSTSITPVQRRDSSVTVPATQKLTARVSTPRVISPHDNTLTRQINQHVTSAKTISQLNRSDSPQVLTAPPPPPPPSPPTNNNIVSLSEEKRESPSTSSSEEKTQPNHFLFQYHVYRTVDKPVFESDVSVLRGSCEYQELLQSYISLLAQRGRAIKDLDQIENLRVSAVRNPAKFIRKLRNGDVVFPFRQKIVDVPQF